MKSLKERILPSVRGSVIGYFLETPWESARQKQAATPRVGRVVETLPGDFDEQSPCDFEASPAMTPGDGDGLVEPGMVTEYDPDSIGNSSGPAVPGGSGEAIEAATDEVLSGDLREGGSWLQELIDDWRFELRTRPWFRILCEIKVMVDEARQRPSVPTPAEEEDPIVAAIDRMTGAIASLERTVALGGRMRSPPLYMPSVGMLAPMPPMPQSSLVAPLQTAPAPSTSQVVTVPSETATVQATPPQTTVQADSVPTEVTTTSAPVVAAVVTGQEDVAVAKTSDEQTPKRPSSEPANP